MPKATLNKPVTVDKKKDKPCSQQRMVSKLYREYRRLDSLVVEARNQMEDAVSALQDMRQQRNEAWEKYIYAVRRQKLSNDKVSGQSGRGKASDSQ